MVFKIFKDNDKGFSYKGNCLLCQWESVTQILSTQGQKNKLATVNIQLLMIYLTKSLCFKHWSLKIKV